MPTKANIAHIEPTYTPAQIAAHLGCDRAVVYDLMRAGRLRHVRLGRTYRVTESALKEFLAGGDE